MNIHQRHQHDIFRKPWLHQLSDLAKNFREERLPDAVGFFWIGFSSGSGSAPKLGDGSAEQLTVVTPWHHWIAGIIPVWPHD